MLHFSLFNTVSLVHTPLVQMLRLSFQFILKHFTTSPSS